MAPRMFLRAFFVSAATLLAAVVPELTLEELTAGSEIAVHGRVVRSWAAWDASNRYIWTHHEIQVIDSLDGASRRTLIASEPGGELDGIAMQVSGQVPYAAGEELVLFLYRTPIGYLRATGHGQGKYTIRGSRLHPNLGGAQLASPAGAISRGTSLRTIGNLDLETFKRQIRAMMRKR